MIKFNHRLSKKLFLIPSRSFSESGDINLQGKYGILPKLPQDGAKQYDPRKIPKLFSEVGKTDTTHLDDAIELLISLDPNASKKQL